MARQDLAFIAFNRGLVSRLGLARADVKRVALSAEEFENFTPRILGSMSIRPGTTKVTNTRNNERIRMLAFVFDTGDKALIELANGTMRVLVNDAVITRPTVTSTITNGTFAADISGWTDGDESGAVSSWASSGYLQLNGNGSAASIRTQEVTVAGGNINTEHALRIVIATGPVTLLVGSTDGADDYIRETDLDIGEHSIAFTPTGNFFIRFQSRLARFVQVDSVTIESAGEMFLPTPWPTASLNDIRKAPSGDILFVAANGVAPYKIERRNTRSWSVVMYQSNDGPFRVANTSPITMTPSTLTGNGTLTASGPIFRSGHLNALFSVTSTGQLVASTITAQNTFTDPIEITGVSTDRAFTIIIDALTATGTTITLQRSFVTPTDWVDVSTYTTDQVNNVQDAFDNQIVYYRLGCVTGDYVAGTILCQLSTAVGSITGIARIRGVSSSTVATIEVVRAFGAVSASSDWAEGKWSAYRGYPSSVAIYEGRMTWAGKDTVAMSVSDDYYSFDADVEGASGPIVRSIGSGPVDTIHWLLPLQRLVVGGQGAEHSCRSNSFDEPLTPTNFNLKKAARQGSANVEAVEVDDTGVHVQRGGTRVYELSFDGAKLDYTSSHLSAMIPDIGKPGIVRIAVQRQPETRVHFVRSDGVVLILTFDKTESVTCWSTIVSDGASGEVEDVCVLPGDDGENEDHVYYAVKRTINGSTVRFIERVAFEEDCRPGNVCKLADCATVFGGNEPLDGLDYLEGQEVVVWMDGRDVGTAADGSLIYTVTGGEVPGVGEADYGAVVGLPYRARWKSGKLTQLQSQVGLALKADKTIAQLGLILADCYHFGIKFGRDFGNLDDMPSTDRGAIVDDDATHVDYDEQSVPFPGTYTTDQRICLQAAAPRPVTVVALVTEVTHHG